jgi:ribonuclease HI
MNRTITVYTDGSCHTQYCSGSWVAIIISGDEKIVLSGTEQDTTHQRMELIAVIKSLEYIHRNYTDIIHLQVISDSQYVTGLPARREKITAKNFSVNKGTAMQNDDLVKLFFQLLDVMPVEFIKIKAHQKLSDAVKYNIEADELSRKLVREAVKKRNE